MSTRSTIIVKTENGYAHVYCHYDGYPSHMLPALQNVNEEDILNAARTGGIRGLEDNGEVDAFNDEDGLELDVRDRMSLNDESYAYHKNEDGEWVCFYGALGCYTTAEEDEARNQ